MCFPQDRWLLMLFSFTLLFCAKQSCRVLYSFIINWQDINKVNKLNKMQILQDSLATVFLNSTKSGSVGKLIQEPMNNFKYKFWKVIEYTSTAI